MNSKTTIFIVITVIFIAVAVGLEYLHRSADLETNDVPAEYMQPLDTTLVKDFEDNLSNRQGNVVGEDLVY